jgi:hypothetical protein
MMLDSVAEPDEFTGIAVIAENSFQKTLDLLIERLGVKLVKGARIEATVKYVYNDTGEIVNTVVNHEIVYPPVAGVDELDFEMEKAMLNSSFSYFSEMATIVKITSN